MTGAIKYYCIVAALLAMNAVYAQLYTPKIIAIDDNNTTLTVNKLYKNNIGIFWVGTSDGLYKFIGNKSSKIFGIEAGNSHITAVGQDSSGTMWIGTKAGMLYKMENRLAKPFLVQTSPIKSAITDIACTANKQLVFSTAGEGIYRYENERLVKIDANDGLSDDYVNCLLIKENTVIAGTDRGISIIKFDKGKTQIQIITSKNGLPDNIIKSLAFTNEDNILLVGTQAKGVLSFNLATKEIFVDNGLPNSEDEIYDMLRAEGKTYVISAQSGLIINRMPVKNIAKPSQVEADNEGNIWLSSGANMVKYENIFFNQIHNPLYPNGTNVLAVCTGAGNKIYYTDGKSIFVYDSFRSKNDKFSTISNTGGDITCLHYDEQGYVWAGTMAGIYRINSNTGQKRLMNENPEIAKASILCISGKVNEVWVSSLNGVAKFSLTENNRQLQVPIAFKNYSMADGIGSNYVYQILAGSNEKVWLATDGAGVSIYNENTFSHLDTSMQSSVVYSIAEDAQKNVWFNTYKEGLFRYKNNRLEKINATVWLSNANITSIAADNSNNLVLVSSKGIDVLNTETFSTTHNGIETGMAVKQGALNAIAKDSSGIIWIGTENGLLRFNSGKNYSTRAPVVVLDDIYLFNLDMAEHWKKIFSYDQNNLTFYYSAINYSMPEKITYEYYLEGYDTKWNQTRDQSLVFPKLPPGKYTLRLRASATLFFDASPITEYHFVIKKPFWLQWWFLALALVITAGLIYALIKWRSNQARLKQQAEKERIQLQYDILKTQVNPHFLFNSFNALLNVVEDDPKEASAMIMNLSTFYRKMTAYRGKDLITVEEELELLHSYISILQKRFGDALKLNIDLPEKITKQSFIPPLVLQLLAENAVKHNAISLQSPLYININLQDEKICMQNNILPKLSVEAGEGLGLQNIRDRYKAFSNKEVWFGNLGNNFVVKLQVIVL